MKKRWIVFPVALLLITGLMLAGCGDGDDDDKGTGPIIEPDTGINYTVTVNGELNKKTTDFITLTFEATIARGGLALTDITFAPAGAITVSSMTDANGPTRIITVTEVASQGEITIKITKEGITSREKTVTVYKEQGMTTSDDVTIADVVKVGVTPSLPANSAITFGKNKGDPIAILPPVTKEPISAMSATAPGLEQDFVVFDPPLDLTTTAKRDFRWFEMVWDNFGNTYEIDGTTYVVYQTSFRLDLTNEAGENIRFQKVSESNTTTGDKNPVQFLKSEIVTAGGAGVAWGDTGQKIKAAKITIYGVQFRTQANDAWPTLGSSSVPSAAFDDLWISSLTVDTTPPPAPKVLYNSATGWIDEVRNPKWAIGDDIDLRPTDQGYADKVHSADDGALEFFGQNDQQKVFRWDGFDITIPESAGTAQYTRLVIAFTGNAVGWYGRGSISENTTGDIIKQMAWEGPNTSGTGGFVVPLTMAGYTPNQFYPQKFRGFFIQWNGNGSNNQVTITEIRLE